MKYNGSNFDEVIAEHENWVKSGLITYSCADFCNADLSGRSFKGLNLRSASFSGAFLLGVDFSGANLEYARLNKADLRDANFTEASLRRAELLNANLMGANLTDAILFDADLYRANLRNADLTNVKINNFTSFYEAVMLGAKGASDVPMACPDTGEFIGWKLCIAGRRIVNVDELLANFFSGTCKDSFVIVKLKIPADAKRTSANGRKCRANKAIVLEIQAIDGTPLKGVEAYSMRDETFVYRVGETVKSKLPFQKDRFIECGSGIHFFINRSEAVRYIYG